MASFTDNPQALTNFTPYIAQNPVEAMAGVGIQRETEFRQGVQKVQGWVDGLLGLPVAKAETQQYIRNQVGKMQGSVNQSLAGDFSDQRLLNQIGGLADRIAGDPIVTNGIRSTAAVQAGMAQLEEAKKSGKGYSVQNEAYWNNAVGAWQNDGDVKSSFNSTYTPHTDYIDKFLKLYKEQHPGEDIPQDAFRYDDKGNKVINPVLFKGLAPGKIQAIWNLTASQPDVQQQLGIDGWYNYRGVAPEMMYKHLTDETNQFLKANEDAIKTMQTKLQTDGNAKADDLNASIEALKQANQGKKERYNSLVEGLKRNPDGVKTRLTEENVMNSLVNGYSYTQMEESPLWKTSMEQSKFDQQSKQWMLDYNEKVRKNNWDMVMDQAKLEVEKFKAMKAAKAGKAEEIPTTISNYVTQEQGAKGEQTAIVDRDNAQTQYVQEQRKLAASMAIGGEENKKPFVLDPVTQQWAPNIGPGIDQFKTENGENSVNHAAYVLLKAARESYIAGDASNPAAMAQMNGAQKAYDNLQNKQKVIDDVHGLYGPQIEKIKAALPQVSIPTEGGKALTTSDLADIWMIKKDKIGKEAAWQRLTGKFGNAAYNVMSETNDVASPGVGAPSSQFGAQARYKRPYDQIAQILDKNKDISVALDKMNVEFKNRQTATVAQRVTYDANKPDEVMAMSNAFESMLSPMKDLNPGSKKGAVNDMLALLGSDKDHPANHFESWVNKSAGTATLRVSRTNTTPITIDIPLATYYQKFPDQQVTDNFQESFGSKLALNQNRGTGTGRTTAIPVALPTKSPYTFQYHLENTGAGWNIRAWIGTKNNKDVPIVSGQILNESLGIPTNMTESQVLEYVRNFQDPTYVDQMVKFKTAPPQQ